MLGIHATPETIARLNRELGFDQPIYVQYVRYITNALQGNFGYSLVKFRDQPVGVLIAERLPSRFSSTWLRCSWASPLAFRSGCSPA